MNKSEIEKALKDKLIKQGVNQEWIDSHLIIDTSSLDDDRKEKEDL